MARLLAQLLQKLDYVKLNLQEICINILYIKIDLKRVDYTPQELQKFLQDKKIKINVPKVAS